MSDLESLRRSLDAVRERIARAAERAGRRAADVLLIGVSKTVPADRVRLGVQAGLTALGENLVQISLFCLGRQHNAGYASQT